MIFSIHGFFPTPKQHKSVVIFSFFKKDKMRTKNVSIVNSCKYNVFLLSRVFRNRLFHMSPRECCCLSLGCSQCGIHWALTLNTLTPMASGLHPKNAMLLEQWIRKGAWWRQASCSGGICHSEPQLKLVRNALTGECWFVKIKALPSGNLVLTKG